MQQLLLWGLGLWLVSRAGRRNNVPTPPPAGPSRPGVPTQMRPGGGGSSAAPASGAPASSGGPVNRGGDPSQRGMDRRQQV